MDFNGDGYADILWQNANGQPAVWFMGEPLINQSDLSMNPGTTWHVVGTGDFNDDGHEDILWEDTTGELAIWFMNGTAIIGGGTLALNPGTGWSVVGVGDFDGDGHADILFQNSNDQVAIWLMNGTAVAGGGIITATPGAGWKAVGSGDFNGDGYSDILWQNSNGEAAIWLMNGTNLIGGGTMANNPGAGWSIVGSGDFNHDGNSDIVWQNDNGEVSIWFMSANNIIGGGILKTNPGAEWKVVSIADYNGDGYADLLWQNATNSQPVLWTMKGISPTPGPTLPAPTPGLKVSPLPWKSCYPQACGGGFAPLAQNPPGFAADSINYFAKWGCSSSSGLTTITKLNILTRENHTVNQWKDSTFAGWSIPAGSSQPTMYFTIGDTTTASLFQMYKAIFYDAQNQWVISGYGSEPDGVSSMAGTDSDYVFNVYKTPGWGPYANKAGYASKIPGVGIDGRLWGTGPLGITAIANQQCMMMNPTLYDYDTSGVPHSMLVSTFDGNLSWEAPFYPCVLPPGSPISSLPATGTYMFNYHPTSGWQLNLSVGLVEPGVEDPIPAYNADPLNNGQFIRAAGQQLFSVTPGLPGKALFSCTPGTANLGEASRGINGAYYFVGDEVGQNGGISTTIEHEIFMAY